MRRPARLDASHPSRQVSPPLKWADKPNFETDVALGPFDIAAKRIWVAGHRGMVGAAVVRRLKAEPCEIVVVGRQEVGLTRQADVERGVGEQRLDAIDLRAARL